MDILYYIGNGSIYNNDELRYSLRSIEKYCKDVDRVFIVGNKPEFLKDVEYIWVEDKYKWHTNACLKTKAAIEAGISEDFLLMNDDFFMLKPFEAKKYPHYHKGDIPEKPNNEYQKIVVNTGNYLKSLGKPFKHYGVHCPMRINAKKYMLLERYFFEPMSIRCLYGNLFCEGVETKDNKDKVLKKSETGCFSSTPVADGSLMMVLKELYPEPSRWEKTDV